MKVTVVFVSMVALLVFAVAASRARAKSIVPDQAVLVHFDYGKPDWAPFFDFEKVLEKAINDSGAGDYDGNELAVDGSDGSLYMYGPDADKLFSVAKPILLSTPLLKNIVVTLRYGGVKDRNVREVVVRLGS